MAAGMALTLMSDGLMVFLIILFILVVAGITLAVKWPSMKAEREKRIRAEQNGDLIKRDAGFYKDEEIFTAHIPDMKAFGGAMTEALRGTGVCNLSGSYDSTVSLGGTKRSWQARLVKLESDGDMVRYSFGVTHYTDSTNEVMGMALDLNYVLTAMEKTFLKFDPNTKVETKAIDFKSHRSLF